MSNVLLNTSILAIYGLWTSSEIVLLTNRSQYVLFTNHSHYAGIAAALCQQLAKGLLKTALLQLCHNNLRQTCWKQLCCSSVTTACNRPVDRPLRTCQNRQVQGERTHPDIGLLTTGFNRSVADLFRLARNWLYSSAKIQYTHDGEGPDLCWCYLYNRNLVIARNSWLIHFYSWL
jgi:hypothetical protein